MQVDKPAPDVPGRPPLGSSFPYNTSLPAAAGQLSSNQKTHPRDSRSLRLAGCRRESAR